MLTNDQLALWDRESFFHPSTHLAQHARGETPSRIITGGSGVFIEDRDGKRLLDAFAGLYCVNVGYGRTEIAEAIAEQARELAYYHAYVGHGTEASITLARMILDRAPKGMSKVYFGLGGSDANETNIKLVWYYSNILGRPEKKKIISRWRGYHGSGLMTGSLTGLEGFHKKFDLPLYAGPPHRGALLFPPPGPGDGRGRLHRPLRRGARGADRPRGRRHHRRLHRRAGARHRRHRPAAGRLLAGDPGGAAPPRHPADRRRGGDRLRPPRQHVRLGPLRHRARHHHHRQGPDLGLRPALRLHRRRQGLEGAGAGHRRVRRHRPRLDLLRPPDRRRRRRSPT